MSILVIIVLVCANLIATFLLWTFTNVCLMDSYKYQIKLQGFCKTVVHIGISTELTNNWWVSLIVRVLLLDPFFVFFMTNTWGQEPHDCFECYNRLPGVRYSSFQYSAYERNRNLESRYGKGAVKIYEDLVRQAQQEVDRENRQKLKET